MDLNAYAEAAGKARETLSKKVMAWRVLSVVHVDHETAKESWRNLAEIHSSPEWLWPAKTLYGRLQFKHHHRWPPGGHAAQSGMDLNAYAEAAGKARINLQYKVQAWRVLSSCHTCDTENAKSYWRNLAEIHSSPEWLWPAILGQPFCLTA